ncbi:electron transfer complex subunit TmcD [Desulfohalobium retbaense]|uniref:WD40 repeat domain-containing protein n=1 Tax=Desulfohalobium retbaense (strain ATCC 49708 / DSM 5692 / JCM 16813 / HR100) TaxID=485915 RepID=C8X1Z5_DESRD|nr:WD40 repeat domain-containing protein [Desulfohalobium retbaense]ACV68318.1 conserved hypothetical protein [Desulfohalobium retbaense DSM 5692]
MVLEWDWEPGDKLVHDTSTCTADSEWIEEPIVSPDGQRVASVVKLGEFEFGLSVNGTPWETTFDRIWYPRFTPDGRLTAITQQEEEWTISIEGTPWEETYGFVWQTMFSEDGAHVAAAVQQDMQFYGVTVDGKVWENMFEAATDFVFSPKGNASAAVAQVQSFGQADIFTFQNGCFTVAVNGEPWDSVFVNAWTPTFDATGTHVAAQVRHTLYDYTIAVDGKPWAQTFNAVWEPTFHPQTGAVLAPVRHGGAWGLAQDGQFIWQPRYAQLWKLQFSPDGQRVAAVCAPRYGHWTVTVDDTPWHTELNQFITDLRWSPDSQRIGVIGKEGNRWKILVDDTEWPGDYDMTWAPVFSPDSQNVAAKVEQNGKYTVLLNGKAYKEEFDGLWDPVFSPDGTHLLLRAMRGTNYHRIVVPISEFA